MPDKILPWDCCWQHYRFWLNLKQRKHRHRHFDAVYLPIWRGSRKCLVKNT